MTGSRISRKPASAARSLTPKALYSISELARAARISRQKLGRLLRANGVTFAQSGRSLFVSLGDIQRKIPALWDGMVALETMRVLAIVRAHEPCASCPRRPPLP